MSSAATTTASPSDVPAKRPVWEKIGNGLVLLAYSCVVLFTVRYHEKWADEAQAWLLARDLDLKTLWFHELRYEGHPGLWHTILWMAQRVFHASYGALGYIGVGFAIAGAAVLVFKAPFPWYVRWPLAFTYVMVYQYAVISRPYTLLPLLCFAVAIFFKDQEHPWKITVVLVLLSLLILHGAVLAVCFGLLYLLEARKSWPVMDDHVRNQYFVCAAAIALTFLLLFIVLKPPPDIEEFAVKKQLAELPDAVKVQMQMPTPARKGTAIVSGAFLDFLVPSFAFLVLTAAWCFTRHRLLLFILPVGCMIALYSVVHGYAHHHGTAFLAAVTALWIAWPSEEEQDVFSRRQTWELRGMLVLLLALCTVNIWDAAVVISREYRYPYSGAEDAAKYLRSVGADRGPMFGLLYGVAAVNAYFDHNLFANNPTTYFHHGLPLPGTYLDVSELYRIRPEYVVVYSVEPDLLLREGASQLTSRGYEIVHFSDGYYLYKQGVYQREAYFILRRTHPD